MHEQITCALFLRWSRHDFVLEKILIRICIYYPIFLYFLHRVGEILIYILHAYYKMFSRKCNHYTSFRAQTGTTSNERYDNSTFHCRNIQQQCLSTQYLKRYQGIFEDVLYLPFEVALSFNIDIIKLHRTERYTLRLESKKSKFWAVVFIGRPLHCSFYIAYQNYWTVWPLTTSLSVRWDLTNFY